MKSLGLFLLGFAIGVGAALYIGWELAPRAPTDLAPSSLRADYRDEYIRLTALAYQTENDSLQAQQRLVALNPTEPAAPLIEMTERWITQNKPAALIVPLVLLCRDWGVSTPAMLPYLQRELP